VTRSNAAESQSHRIAGIVLAGGQNSRMGGADKAFLQVGRRPIVERTIELFRRSFDEVVVVSNAPDKYARFGVLVVPDEFPNVGPLAGIHAGLGGIAAPYAFVAACDMPYLQAEAIGFLIGRLRDQDAVIPIWDDDLEPLHALYAASLRPRIEDALRRGVRGIREFLPEIRVDYVPEAELRTVRGAADSFCNVNTPEEAALHAVERPAALAS
jgi:molybdopterin-guanine dinucleotide biosynthesis protein A